MKQSSAMSDERVERVARAMLAVSGADPDDLTPAPRGRMGLIPKWKLYEHLAKAALEAGGLSETGWLIEDRSPGDYSLYMTLSSEPMSVRYEETRRRKLLETFSSPLAFTKDSNVALRFSRREDAEAFVHVFRRFMLCPEVTEHEWMPLPQAPEVSHG